MTRNIETILAAAAMALGASACGSGSSKGGSGLASAPVPPPAATPAPAPTPTSAPVIPPLPSGPMGLQSNEPFATHSAWTDGWGTVGTDDDAVTIKYYAADNIYTLKIPQYEEEGTLVPKSGNGTYGADGWRQLVSTNSDLTTGQGVVVILERPEASRFSYTNFGEWLGGSPMGENFGVFAYGSPTIAAEMPRTGNASYRGEIRGMTNGEPLVDGSIGPVHRVTGTVLLAFDFGAGTMTGQMNPEIAPVWDPVSLGTYTFVNTVYAVGSTVYSGSFDTPGLTAPSAFLGRFTGPGGAEVMANWQAPFLDPVSGGSGTMMGIWIAKKDS